MSDPKEPTPLSAEIQRGKEFLRGAPRGTRFGLHVTLEELTTIDAQATEIAALKGALEDAWSRMDRARKSLHKDENSQWLVLDTHLDRERMARVLAGKEDQG